MYKAFGLLFFTPVIDYSLKGCISIVIICNGLLCHGSSYLDIPYQGNIYIYDVICNFVMGIFVTYTTEYQIFTTIIFTISIYNFILNQLLYDSSILLHIMGIQLPLSIALSFYQL